MELLIHALEEPQRAEQAIFRFGREGDMNAGRAVDTAKIDETRGEEAANLIFCLLYTS